MPSMRGAVRGRGLERLRRRHAGLHEPAELARVLAEPVKHRVGAHADLHARLDRALAPSRSCAVGTSRQRRHLLVV